MKTRRRCFLFLVFLHSDPRREHRLLPPSYCFSAAASATTQDSRLSTLSWFLLRSLTLSTALSHTHFECLLTPLLILTTLNIPGLQLLGNHCTEIALAHCTYLAPICTFDCTIPPAQSLQIQRDTTYTSLSLLYITRHDQSISHAHQRRHHDFNALHAQQLPQGRNPRLPQGRAIISMLHTRAFAISRSFWNELLRTTYSSTVA